MEIIGREAYAELELDSKVELIRSLIPLGLMHVRLPTPCRRRSSQRLRSATARILCLAVSRWYCSSDKRAANPSMKRARSLVEDAKRIELRAERCKPIVDEFFEWMKETLKERVLLPSNPFTEAANYTLDREVPLRVFLEYPDVPIDTNHLEREIRPIALGRKNWLFCWTEIGAKYVGIFQSLLVTCRLQGIDPYTYLVDVLQRVESHPARDVASLTPRLWKERFAADPLRSTIDRPGRNAPI